MQHQTGGLLNLVRAFVSHHLIQLTVGTLLTAFTVGELAPELPSNKKAGHSYDRKYDDILNTHFL